MAQESTNFCLSSAGRNRFLQRPSGLFGGDEWFLGTYSAVDDHYRRSDVYSHTVTVWNDTTNIALYQREPVACWYAMGTAVLAELPPPEADAGLLLRCQWSLSPAVWTTARVPGQCVTFVLDGQTVHATLTPAATASLLVATVPTAAVLAAVRALWRVGQPVPYMVRTRAPGLTLPGPVVRTGPATVLVQAPSAAAVAAGEQALLYLGGRSAHPVRTCALAAPADAKASVYGIAAVARVASDTALCSTAQAPATEAWEQVTQHLAVGALRLSPAVVPTGFSYRWPYPADQTGTAWLLAAAAAPPAGLPASPSVVWLLRAATAVVDAAGLPAVALGGGGAGSPTIVDDGTPLHDGDRVLVLSSAAAASLPVRLCEWDTATGTFLPSAALPPAGGDLLAVVEGARARAWWWPMHATTGAPLPGLAYRSVAAAAHAAGETGGDVDVSAAVFGAAAAAAAGTALAAAVHCLVLLLRSANGLYAPTPTAVGCNLYDKVDPAWVFPVTTADGSDRLALAGLTDGLVVFGHRAPVPGTGRPFRAPVPTKASGRPCPAPTMGPAGSSAGGCPATRAPPATDWRRRPPPRAGWARPAATPRATPPWSSNSPRSAREPRCEKGKAPLPPRLTSPAGLGSRRGKPSPLYGRTPPPAGTPGRRRVRRAEEAPTALQRVPHHRHLPPGETDTEAPRIRGLGRRVLEVRVEGDAPDRINEAFLFLMSSWTL